MNREQAHEYVTEYVRDVRKLEQAVERLILVEPGGTRVRWFPDDYREAVQDVYDCFTAIEPAGDLLAAISPSAPSVVAELAFVPFEEFAAIHEEGATPLVVVTTSDRRLRAAIPAGSLGLAYGDAGAGKTTLLLDQAFHWATGTTWGGLLEPARPLTIAWIEGEGPRPMMREKLAAKLDGWHGPPLDGRLQVLSEPWAAFTFRDDTQRAALVQALDTLDVDLVIAGPLGRIGMEGGGTSDEIRDFLTHVEHVLAACKKRPALIVIHHQNKAGAVSGAWEREPDTLIHVQAQGHGRTRVYWQKVRWASDLHATSSHLLWAPGEGFTIEEKPEITEDTIADDLRAAVRQLPGGSWTKLRALVTGNATEAAAVRDRLLATGEIVNVATREGYFNLHPSDDPAVTRSEPGTALERLPFRTPGGEPDPSRSTVPPFNRNGGWNGTGSDDPGPHIDQDEIERLADLAREAQP